MSGLPESQRHRYYLVQRLQSRDPIDAKRGFDGFFGLDYMGSAEYEFSTPFESLKEMRSAPLAVFVYPVSVGDVTRDVYFVAHADDIDEKVADFGVWLAAHDEPIQKRPRFLVKEQSWFPEHFKGAAADYQARVDAWWSFDDAIAWTLDRGLAERLLVAFETKKAS